MKKMIAVLQLPSIEIVDFADPVEVDAYAGLMAQMADDLGAFKSTFVPTAEWNCLRVTAKEFVKRLEAQFAVMSPAQKILCDSAYNLAYRMAYAKTTAPRIVNDNLLEAFDAKIHGDRAVDEYALFRSIEHRIKQRDPHFFDKPLAWNSICVDRWLKHQYDRKSDYDRLNQVAILLNSRLGAFLGSEQDAFKERLFDSTRHYFEKPLTAVRDLMALDRLLQSGQRYLTPDESARHRANLTQALIAHPDTNRFHREALIRRG